MYSMKHDKKSETKSSSVKAGSTGHMESKVNHLGGDQSFHKYGAGSAGQLSIYLKNKG